MRRGHGRKGKSPGREAGRCGERRRGEDGLGLPCVILSAPLRSSPCRPCSQASAATCATHLSTHPYMVIFILCFVIPARAAIQCCRWGLLLGSAANYSRSRHLEASSPFSLCGAAFV